MTEEEYVAYNRRREEARARVVAAAAAREGSVAPTTEEAAAPGTEGKLHQDILGEVRKRGWIAFHGSTAHRTRRTKGEPDFVVLGDRGRLAMFECKTKSGKLRPDQQALLAHAAKLGHEIRVVRSVGDFLTLFDLPGHVAP
jgi:hypothetical protein